MTSLLQKNVSAVEWKRCLASDSGLFKRFEGRSPIILGPSLTPRGHIIGDLLSMEIATFGEYRSIEQQTYYEELVEKNPIRAREYLLTITNALPLWKEDIRWLTIAVPFLKKEISTLKEEEAVLLKSQEFERNIPRALQRHFPMLFPSSQSVQQTFNELHNSEQRLQEIAQEIENKLKIYRQEMPFLFE